MRTYNVKGDASGTEIIEVNTDVIQSSIEELNRKSEELQIFASNLNYDINTVLPSIWKGQDINNYITTFRSIIDNLNHIRIRIDEHAQALSTVKSIYETLDQEYGSRNCSVQ